MKTKFKKFQESAVAGTSTDLPSFECLEEWSSWQEKKIERINIVVGWWGSLLVLFVFFLSFCSCRKIFGWSSPRQIHLSWWIIYQGLRSRYKAYWGNFTGRTETLWQHHFIWIVIFFTKKTRWTRGAGGGWVQFWSPKQALIKFQRTSKRCRNFGICGQVWLSTGPFICTEFSTAKCIFSAHAVFVPWGLFCKLVMVKMEAEVWGQCLSFCPVLKVSGGRQVELNSGSGRPCWGWWIWGLESQAVASG